MKGNCISVFHNWSSYLNQVPDNWVFNIRKYSLSSVNAIQPHPRHCQPSKSRSGILLNKVVQDKNSIQLIAQLHPSLLGPLTATLPQSERTADPGLSSSKVQLNQTHHPGHIYCQRSIIHRILWLSWCQQAVKKGQRQKKRDHYVAESKDSQDIQGNSCWPALLCQEPHSNAVLRPPLSPIRQAQTLHGPSAQSVWHLPRCELNSLLHHSTKSCPLPSAEQCK